MPTHNVTPWRSELELQYGKFQPTAPGTIEHAGRYFEVNESFAIDLFGKGKNFGKFYGPYFEVYEWAVFDHIPHKRSIYRNGKSKKAAEAYIASRKPLDREAEAKAARAHRIVWLKDQAVPRAEREYQQARKLAGRKFETIRKRNARGVLLKAKTRREVRPDRIEQRAKTLEIKSDKRRTLRVQLRQALKLQASA